MPDNNNADLNLRVVHYTDKHLADPRAALQQLSWQEYHRVRNTIVRTCRKFGPVGPLGECPIVEGEEEPNLRQWEQADPEFVYFIVDDQLNYERYLYLEVLDPDALKVELITEIAKALEDLPFWVVGIANVRQGYILIFSTVVLVTGHLFEDCRDLASVVAVGRGALAV